MKFPDLNRPDEHGHLDDQFDPDILEKLGGPKYGKIRWTFGNSGDLVDGAPKESPWVGIAWVIVPTALALLMLAGMLAA